MALQLHQTSSRLGSSLPLVSVWWSEDGETDGLRNLFLTLISSLRRYPLFLTSFCSFLFCIHILPLTFLLLNFESPAAMGRQVTKAGFRWSWKLLACLLHVWRCGYDGRWELGMK